MIHQPKKPIPALRRVKTDLAALRTNFTHLADQVGCLIRFDEAVKECRRDIEELAQAFDREMAALRSDIGQALKNNGYG